MNIPNIQQELYLKKALNEDTDGMFDHDRLLNELSPQTYTSYIKKAAPDLAIQSGDYGGLGPQHGKSHYKNWRNARRRMGNRIRGIQQAAQSASKNLAEGLLCKYSELIEGSRGLARHQRIVKALTKKAASLKNVSAGERRTDAYHRRFMNKLTLSKGQQERDRVQISRERMRAGLAPGIPSKTVSPPHGDETETWRIKSGADRAPKTVLKYRAASTAKAAKGKAK